MSKVFEVEFSDYEENVQMLFEQLKPKIEEPIVIKPNLTTNLPPPVTTSVECIGAVVKSLKEMGFKEITIAEGSGGYDTLDAFKEQGFVQLAKKYNIGLIDLNRAERTELRDDGAIKLKKVLYPKILIGSYLINVPVPKEHTSAVITNSLKNMFGAFLSEGYLKKWNEEKLLEIGVKVEKRIFMMGWNKADLHMFGVHESIHDLNLYKKPDLTICDGRIGQSKEEVDGIPCDPPLNRMFASVDPVGCDGYAAQLLGHEWKDIKYLRYCSGKFGDCERIHLKRIT